jgi:hypothetical protein
MIEAFERNLRLQKIKLQFDSVTTEDELFKLCEKIVAERKKDVAPVKTWPTKPHDDNFWKIVENPIPSPVKNELTYRQVINKMEYFDFSPEIQKSIFEGRTKYAEQEILKELVQLKYIEHKTIEDAYKQQVEIISTLRI